MDQESNRYGRMWSDIPRRLGTICVGIPILWKIWSHTTMRVLFFQGTHLVMSYEWICITIEKKLDNQYTKRFLSVFVPLISVVCANVSNNNSFVAVLVCYISCLTVFVTNSSSIIAIPVAQSIFLITIPMRTWIRIAGSDERYSFLRTVSLLLTVWNCDTGALITGRIFGRKANIKSDISNRQQLQSLDIFTNCRKWLASISPNKSIEGLIGGLLLGTVTYAALPWLWKMLFHLDLVPSELIDSIEHISYGMQDLVVGFMLSVAAVLGDLWESTLKRQYSAKDSGKLLPGHGGVLDRFDSSLVAAVVFDAFYIQLLNPTRGY